MRNILAAIACLMLCASLCGAAEETERHYLYMASPDGAQGGGSGNGLLVFDMDHDHRFVKRIDIPNLKEGARGICASVKTSRLYISTGAKRIICLDLTSDKVLWEKTYDTGCDRLAITPDGKTLYVPGGFWTSGQGWLVIDAADGHQTGHIDAPAASHNTVVSLDGKRAFLASNSWLSVVDTSDNKVLREIRSNSRNFFPLTVNSDRSRVYICLGQEIGFEIVDPNEGKILETIYPDGPHRARRTHGIGMTPDEKEIWLSDQQDNCVYVFDNTKDPPAQVSRLDISKGGHGWIAFSIDGRFAYTSSVEVFDARTKKVLTVFKDELGKPVCGSKNVEIDFTGDHVSAVGDQFGVGRAKPPAGASSGGADSSVHGMSFLDNGVIRVGVNLDVGGAITWISKSGDKNMVNSFDYGRQVQMSFYSGPVPFAPGGKQPKPEWAMLGWNPIQVGDAYHNPSKTLEHRNDGKSIYLKCRPMQWPLNNETGECVFESRLTLDGATVQAAQRIINDRSDKTQFPACTQELPAIYTNGPWWRLMTYAGQKPFTGDSVEQIPVAFPWKTWRATENWAALVDDNNFGLGIWSPGTYQISGGFAGKPGAGGASDDPTGYIAPNRLEILDANIDYSFSYVLIVGTTDEIRKYVYAHATPSAPPIYRFDKDRQSWWYHDLADTGWPIRDALDMHNTGGDPYLIGPPGFWPADQAPVAYIEAAFEKTLPEARLRWMTYGESNFAPEKRLAFPVLPDGQFHRYEARLSEAPGYKGNAIALRLDPEPAENQIAHIRIRSISLQAPPK